MHLHTLTHLNNQEPFAYLIEIHLHMAGNTVGGRS